MRQYHQLLSFSCPQHEISYWASPISWFIFLPLTSFCPSSSILNACNQMCCDLCSHISRMLPLASSILISSSSSYGCILFLSSDTNIVCWATAFPTRFILYLFMRIDLLTLSYERLRLLLEVSCKCGSVIIKKITINSSRDSNLVSFSWFKMPINAFNCTEVV